MLRTSLRSLDGDIGDAGDVQFLSSNAQDFIEDIASCSRHGIPSNNS